MLITATGSHTTLAPTDCSADVFVLFPPPLTVPLLPPPVVPAPPTAAALAGQQYRWKHAPHTPSRCAPIRARARSTTAHARHAPHSGSDPLMPCVAMPNAWSMNAWTW